MKKKLILEFETIPKLVFVSEDGLKAELYIDGEKVKGARDVTIKAGVGEIVTHKVEYVTSKSGKGGI